MHTRSFIRLYTNYFYISVICLCISSNTSNQTAAANQTVQASSVDCHPLYAVNVADPCYTGECSETDERRIGLRWNATLAAAAPPPPPPDFSKWARRHAAGRARGRDAHAAELDALVAAGLARRLRNKRKIHLCTFLLDEFELLAMQLSYLLVSGTVDHVIIVESDRSLQRKPKLRYFWEYAAALFSEAGEGTAVPGFDWPRVGLERVGGQSGDGDGDGDGNGNGNGPRARLQYVDCRATYSKKSGNPMNDQRDCCTRGLPPKERSRARRRRRKAAGNRTSDDGGNRTADADDGDSNRTATDEDYVYARDPEDDLLVVADVDEIPRREVLDVLATYEPTTRPKDMVFFEFNSTGPWLRKLPKIKGKKGCHFGRAGKGARMVPPLPAKVLGKNHKFSFNWINAMKTDCKGPLGSRFPTNHEIYRSGARIFTVRDARTRGGSWNVGGVGGSRILNAGWHANWVLPLASMMVRKIESHNAGPKYVRKLFPPSSMPFLCDR